MAKRFTLVEAQSLIPEVERLLREALEARTGYQEAEQAIQQFAEHVMMMGGVMVDRGRVYDARARREEAGARMRGRVDAVLELGCEIKSLDEGLVDFPTVYRGEEVCLCWKLGERGIGFWHSTEEGYQGRKPIDQEFVDHHEGDRPQ